MIGINVKKGIITDPVKYLSNRFGIDESNLEESKSRYIETERNVLCSDYGNHGNCTLVAMTNILPNIFRSVSLCPGYKEHGIYERVRNIAEGLGYNPNLEKGLNVIKNRSFAKKCCASFFEKKMVTYKTRFAGTGKLAIKLIDKGIPYILSVAYGVYFDHSVCIVGYKEYRDKTTGRTYTFLITHDGWEREERYIAWKNAGRHWPVCITAVIPLNKESI